MFCYQHKFVADGNIFYPSPGLLDSCLCSTCSKSRLQHHDLKKGVRAFLAFFFRGGMYKESLSRALDQKIEKNGNEAYLLHFDV